tara:strand:+ start:311 stop:619 length:309 start_codon:yes stop_codon:yes gene_type:complete
MTKQKRNNNFINFIYYSSIIIVFTIILILFLSIKNQCIKTRNEIISLNKSLIKQTGAVKDLQSKQEYHLSEKHISQMIRNKMKVTTPEPIIIIVPEEMAVNE